MCSRPAVYFVGDVRNVQSNGINCYYFFELQEAMAAGSTPAKEKNLKF
jgi:hypothetical protein